jgi:hypothetical protein
VLDAPTLVGAGDVEPSVATVDPPSADAGPVPFGPEPQAATTTDIATTAAKRGLERRLCIGGSGSRMHPSTGPGKSRTRRTTT